MDETNRREALISLGYREEAPGIWMKPVGYHLFTFHEDRNVWENWFRDILGKIGRYETKPGIVPDGTSYLSLIKTYEAYTRINIGDGSSEFHLSAIIY